MQDAKKERSVRVDYEVLGGLNRLFADTSEALSAKWSEQFSLKVDLGLEIGAVRSFRQFAYSQQPPFNLAQLRNRVDHTNWWLVVHASSASVLLDLLLGSQRVDWKPLNRSLNAIESELILPVIDEISSTLSEIWRPVTELDLTLFQWYHDLPEIESDLEEILDVEMVCIKWRLSVGKHQSQMGLCLPVSFVLAWAKKLVQHHYGELPLEPQYDAVVELVTDDVELSKLEVGDVLAPGHSIETPLTLHVSNGDQLKVKLGAQDGRKAFQIVE